MNRRLIESISTARSSVVVNQIGNRYELIFKKDNRHHVTVWLASFQKPLIQTLISQFLTGGEQKSRRLIQRSSLSITQHSLQIQKAV